MGARRERTERFVVRVTVAAGTVLGVLLAIPACGDGDSAARPTFAFTDAKGRQCTQVKFGLVATCAATSTPRNACAPGNHPCFIVYAGNVTAGVAGVIGPPPLWNCDACCADVGVAWTGVSDDCSSYTCKTNDDCTSEDGTCETGQCHAGVGG